ncbi:MAG: tetratricopeptide repeat protein [Anaerolineae bacterium]
MRKGALFEMIGKTADAMTAVMATTNAKPCVNSTCAGVDLPEEAAKTILLKKTATGIFSFARAIWEKEKPRTQPTSLAETLKVLVQYGFIGFTGDRYTVDPLVVEAIVASTTMCGVFTMIITTRWRGSTIRRKRTICCHWNMPTSKPPLNGCFGSIRWRPIGWRVCAVSIWLIVDAGAAHGVIETAAASLASHPDEALCVSVQNELGIVYQNHPFGDRAASARDRLRSGAGLLTPEHAPMDYAMTNNLGTVYSELAGIEDREANLKRAIITVSNFQAALVYWTPEHAPMDYAMTQNNLGAAYNDLAAFEEREANLKRAVAAYEAALPA